MRNSSRKYIKKYVESLLETPQMEKFRDLHYKGLDKFKHALRRGQRIEAMTDVVMMIMSKPYYVMKGEILPEQTSLKETYIRVEPMMLANAIIGQIDTDVSLTKEKAPPRIPLKDS